MDEKVDPTSELLGRLSILEDVSNRMSQSIDLALALFQSYPDAVVVVDGNDGSIVMANRQAEFLFGRLHSELRTMRVEQLLPESRNEAHLQHRANYMMNPTPRAMGVDLDTRIVRKGGKEVQVFISLAPVVLNDGIFITVALRPKEKWSH